MKVKDSMKPLPRSFFNRDTLTVAKELLGKILVHQTRYGDIAAKIVEVEAYKGSDDPASHAFRKKTPRNQLMFGKAGFAYIYFVYGNHHCLNVTTEKEGFAGAVLIRAVEILEGLEIAKRNRVTKPNINLSNGPGKLTKALGISKAQNGIDLTKRNKLFISIPMKVERFNTTIAGRIGVKQGADKLWRFYIENNEFVSKM